MVLILPCHFLRDPLLCVCALVRCVAVGVPAKVLGQGKKRNPALAMRQDFLKEVWHGSDI